MAVVFVDVTLPRRLWVPSFLPAAEGPFHDLIYLLFFFSEVPFNDFYEGKCHMPSAQRAPSPDG